MGNLDEAGKEKLAAAKSVIELAAGELADSFYPDGLPWGTRFDDLEELAMQAGRAVAVALINRGVGGQAASDIPGELQCCPKCRGPLEEDDPEPRIVATRAGDAEWSEPRRMCRRCRRAFFPSVQELGD